MLNFSGMEKYNPSVSLQEKGAGSPGGLQSADHIPSGSLEVAAFQFILQ